MENKQCRWKSKAMWFSILSGIALIYNSIATEFNYPVISNESVNSLLNLIFGLLTLFGVVNNPTNKDEL